MRQVAKPYTASGDPVCRTAFPAVSSMFPAATYQWDGSVAAPGRQPGVRTSHLCHASQPWNMDTPMTEIRPPAVAGAFYPSGSRSSVRDLACCSRARRVPPDAVVPKALIAPHAGYIYSGPVAASAYARLAPARGRIKRVVLLGPAHRVAVDGLVLPGALGLQTPLGDRTARSRSRPLDRVAPAGEREPRGARARAFPGGALAVPAGCTGHVRCGPAGGRPRQYRGGRRSSGRLWGGDETLIVVSSDLSHYLGYEQAQATDRETARTILLRRPAAQLITRRAERLR